MNHGINDPVNVPDDDRRRLATENLERSLNVLSRALIGVQRAVELARKYDVPAEQIEVAEQAVK